MKPAAAFKGTIHGIRTVPSRKVVQITIETAIEELPRIAAIAEHGAWVGIARLEEPSPQEKEPSHDTGRLKTPIPRRVDFAPPAEAAPDKSPRPWSALSYATQAGIRCGEPLFAAFLREVVRTHLSPVEYVYVACGVMSRADIRTETFAGEQWAEIEKQFSAWKAAERVGAI